MGKDLAERFPAARDTFEAIDEALGVPLSRLMWEGPEDELDAHPQRPARDPRPLRRGAAPSSASGSAPSSAAAGHSLGEYSAYVAAGALSAADAARLVRRRGELMYEAGTGAPRRDGRGARAGRRARSRRPAREASGADGVAVAANLNAPDQMVISGDPAAVARAGEACKARRRQARDARSR